MVLQKRSDYGFSGYRVPPTPRAARSVRKRCLFKRKANDSPMCAFDLLATVAGKFLLDGESCPQSVNTSSRKEQQPEPAEVSIKKEEIDENKSIEEKSHNRECYERNFLFTELVSEALNSNICSNELASTQNDAISRPASGVTSSDGSEKVGSAEQLVNDDCKLSLGIFTPSSDIESPAFKSSANCGSEDENRKQIKMESANTRTLSLGNKASLPSRGNWEKKPSALVSSNDSLKFPVTKHHTPFPVNWVNVNLGNRDDDEKYSECTHDKAPARVGECRFKNPIVSKHIKTTPEVKDEQQCNDTERSNYLNRKNSLKLQRSLRDYPFKKRKIYDYNSLSNADEVISNDGKCTTPMNATNENVLSSGPTSSGVVPAPPAANHASFQSRNAQVKLKIKSFRVPELLIEIPETASVGSLKRTVLDAVNAVLGGGLRVGVLFQGKKIRDDNKSLLQTGISQESKMDTLGFALEPNPSAAQIRLFPEDCRDQMLCESPQPLARYPPVPRMTQITGQQRNLDAAPDIAGTNFTESDHDSAPSPPTLSRPAPSESKALIPLPSAKQDALAVVPLRKSKRSESAQRRIRRPFTVAEVEALVQAVEKLGTGRWRDVKLRAFDSAKHRTYVDLKDKWKTLVHTARISPQQRRGEPVPQELLDRVLTAHAYWSQQQAKQQLKSHPDTCLLL